MRAKSEMVKSKALAKHKWKMARHTMVIGKMVRSMALDSIHSVMEMCTRANLIMISQTGTEKKSSKFLATSTKASGKMVKPLDRVSLFTMLIQKY